jgi:uncharacterized repeat protein (TIGR03803 family)
MQMQAFSVRCRAVLSILAALLFVTGIATSQESAIFSFYSPYGDALPIGGLTPDSSGNLYGVTFYGGVYGNGMVYELSPAAGAWTMTVLYSFNPNGTDGWGPTSAPVFDAAGNLYGTTEFGGTGGCSIFGCGTVYEISPDGTASWKETILHDFDGSDGWQIHPGLIIDSAGNLYGMATNGGTYSSGTVFELSPSSGSWSFSVLHQFFGGNDGSVPYQALTLDAAGNLYGTASAGGGKSAACKYGCGTVFELSPSGNGTWTEKTLHNFTTNAADGSSPACKLIFDTAGNLYGTTGSGGGASNAGIVFELSPLANGVWIEKVLHNFNQRAADGNGPSNSLTFDASGNLYGATIGGGTHGRGTAFKLSPTSSGPWSETMLNNFSAQGAGGYFPNSGPIFGSDGNLYGIAASGGRNNQGTVFTLAP